jgi:cobaltochelatase CobS
VAAGLNGILDGSPLCIPENGGELVRPHPLFRFAATANTNGGGDETGLYQGTQRQNLAFADRFILCEMGYPDAEVERHLLRRRFPALPASLCKAMVDYANEVRRLFMGDAPDAAEGIEVTFSTRSLLRWGELTVRFQPLAKQGIQPITYALDRALAYRAGRESRAMLHELAQRLFPQQEMPEQENAAPHAAAILSGEEGVRFLTLRLNQPSAQASSTVVLRKSYTRPDGTHASKDWTGTATPDGMTLHFGRTGGSGQDRAYPAQECVGHNPREELERRACQKLREGYRIVVEESVF